MKLESAYATQISNIEKKTGHSLAEFKEIARKSGLQKHGELRSMFMEKFGLGHGDANALVHAVNDSDGMRKAIATGASTDSVLDGIYTGTKSALRPIHELLIQHIDGFGPFEVVPKKGYVSLRRARQFAMIGPGTRMRLELGLNNRALRGDARLEEQPAGGMCHFKVFLTSADEVDDTILDWVRQAYDAAG